MIQAEFSRQTEISPSTISDIYNEMTERLNMEYLDYSITDLIKYIPNKQKKTGKFLIREKYGNCKK